MLSAGFAGAQITQSLFLGLIAVFILVNVANLRHLFYIQAVPLLWPNQQLWRILLWQTSYTTSSDLFFGLTTIYHFRIIERLWGSRKFASFVLTNFVVTSLLLPLVLVLLRPLTLYHFNVVPAGPTPLIFALLAQYQAMIPAISKRHIVLSTSSDGITISDKTLVYFITAKLAFSSLAGSLLAAVVGWGIGVGWRANFSAQTIRSWQNLRWKRGGDAKERNVESSKSKPERGARGVGSATDFDSINSRQRR